MSKSILKATLEIDNIDWPTYSQGEQELGIRIPGKLHIFRLHGLYRWKHLLATKSPDSDKHMVCFAQKTQTATLPCTRVSKCSRGWSVVSGTSLGATRGLA